MADIFISYSRKDRAWVQGLAGALSTHGWSVWWDREIPAGRAFDEVIAEALAGARCVVVVWSKESIASSWVREEADEGRRRAILIPVLIDGARPPLGFGRIQAVDLTGWNGDEAADAFQKLLTDIASKLGPPQVHVARATPPVTPAPDVDVAERHASAPDTHVDAPTLPARESAAAAGASRRRGEAVKWSLLGVVALTVLALGIYWLRGNDAGYAQPRATTAAATESGLRLNAVLTDGGDLLKEGVSYQVEDVVKDTDGNRKRIASSAAYQPPPRFALPAGRYYVTAAYGSASASTEVSVSDAALTLQTLNLRAGVLRLASVLAAGSPPLATGVSYEVYEAATDAEGNRRRVVDSPSYQGPPRFPLAAGRYYVTAAHGSASASTEIDIRAGEIKPHTIDLRAGVLNVSSVAAEGSPPLATGVEYEVYETARDAEGNRKRVVDSPAYQGPPRFVLPAGRYEVVAKYGSASSVSEVDVAAGAIKPHVLNLRAGFLNVSSVMDPGGPLLATGVRYEVYDASPDAEGNRKRIADSPAYQESPRFALPAGRYYVTAASDGRGGDAEVAVSEGKVHQVRVRLSQRAPKRD